MEYLNLSKKSISIDRYAQSTSKELISWRGFLRKLTKYFRYKNQKTFWQIYFGKRTNENFGENILNGCKILERLY